MRQFLASLLDLRAVLAGLLHEMRLLPLMVDMYRWVQAVVGGKLLQRVHASRVWTLCCDEEHDQAYALKAVWRVQSMAGTCLH
jgi:hypothetical protein